MSVAFAAPGLLEGRLLHVRIDDTGPGMDTRSRCTPLGPYDDEAVPDGGRTMVLAELHPDTLPDADLGGADDGAVEAGWPGFFHRARRLLRGRNDLLLLATRQRRAGGRLTDPLGWLVACARTAGFTYLQHIVVVHGLADGDRIAGAPPDTTVPELIHSDLLVFQSGAPGHGLAVGAVRA